MNLVMYRPLLCKQESQETSIMSITIQNSGPLKLVSHAYWITSTNLYIARCTKLQYITVPAAYSQLYIILQCQSIFNKPLNTKAVKTGFLELEIIFSGHAILPFNIIL